MPNRFKIEVGLLFVLIFSLVRPVAAQNALIALPEEINQQMQTLPQNKQVDYLMNLSWQMRWNNPILAVQSAIAALNLIEDDPSKDGERSELYNYIGVINYHLQNDHEAFNFFKKATDAARRSRNHRQFGFACNNMSLIYSSEEKYSLALNMAFKSYNIMKRINDVSGMIFPLAQLSNIYQKTGQYDSSIYYARKIIEISTRRKDKENIVRGNISLGDAFLGMAQSGYGKYYADSALKSYLAEYDSIAAISEIDARIADVYLFKKDYENAVKYAFKGFHIGEQYEIPRLIKYSIGIIINNIGRTREIDSVNYYTKYLFRVHDSLSTYSSGNKIFVLNITTQLEMHEIVRRDYQRMNSIQQLFILILSVAVIIILVFLLRQYFLSKRFKAVNSKIEKELRNNIKLNNKLEEVVGTKDKFFSIIAHDLKNPINSFTELVQIMVRRYDTFSEADRLEFLHMMKMSSTGVYALLENLLQWSRAQQGRIRFTPTDINITYIVDNTIELMKPAAEEKNIRLFDDIHADFFLIADSNLLIAIIRNLLSNSIKFSNPGAEVHFGFVGTDDKFNKFYVKDNGIGMTQEQVSSIFDIALTHSQIGTHGEKGTGLGLIICNEYIKLHGGSIKVESEEGVGTTVTFTISRTLSSIDSNAELLENE